VIRAGHAFRLDGSTLAAGAPLLEITDIGLAFGGIQALDGVSVTVACGHIHALIGPNGAGKSSLINCVSGCIVRSADGSRCTSPPRSST
jgi:branched-chain amino acid transport system ATP-binding protein